MLPQNAIQLVVWCRHPETNQFYIQVFICHLYISRDLLAMIRPEKKVNSIDKFSCCAFLAKRSPQLFTDLCCITYFQFGKDMIVQILTNFFFIGCVFLSYFLNIIEINISGTSNCWKSTSSVSVRVCSFLIYIYISTYPLRPLLHQRKNQSTRISQKSVRCLKILQIDPMGICSLQQESPPAWTQEAHRPPRRKYSLCCSV